MGTCNQATLVLGTILDDACVWKLEQVSMMARGRQCRGCPKPWISGCSRPLPSAAHGAGHVQVPGYNCDEGSCGCKHVDSTSASGFVSFLQPDALSAARKTPQGNGNKLINGEKK